MRRRRLIGMYRELLKSMNLVRSGLRGTMTTTELPCRPGSAETEREPSLTAGYLIGPSSTIDPILDGPSFTAFPAAGWPVVRASLRNYLSTQTSYRNAAGITLLVPRGTLAHDHI